MVECAFARDASIGCSALKIVRTGFDAPVLAGGGFSDVPSVIAEPISRSRTAGLEAADETA